MGSSHSTHKEEHVTSEQVHAQFSKTLETKYDSFELATIQSTFDQLATPVCDSLIWTEDTFAKFLELPDDVSSLLFVSASYIASFPFTTESPTILTFQALLRTISIITGRAEGLLTASERLHLIYNSFSVLEKNVDIPITKEKERKDASNLTDSRSSTAVPLMRKEDFERLLRFLLSIQEKSNLQVVSHFIEHFQGETARRIRDVSSSILSTVVERDTMSVTYDEIAKFMQSSPELLSALVTLYAHFLFPAKTNAQVKAPRHLDPEMLLDDATSAQLSLFLPRDLVFGKVDALYRASVNGFSMGSFETKVIKYPGPTVLLLTGSCVDGQEAKFGMFSNIPWKLSSKETFGDDKTILFQLSPKHRVFRSPELQHNAWFTKSVGIGIGCDPPSPARKNPDYGSLSLVIDTSLEIATFRHESETQTVKKIEIEEVEVWGLGGDREAQRKAWEWEEAEANRRRTVNVKDMQADYDLLEMAGLVGQNRSGGSV